MVGITKNVTFHSARRTFATFCRDNGISENLIGAILGHKPENVTDSYMQWDTYTANKAATLLSCFDLKKLKNLA